MPLTCWLVEGQRLRLLSTCALVQTCEIWIYTVYMNVPQTGQFELFKERKNMHRLLLGMLSTHGFFLIWRISNEPPNLDLRL